jgi:hypothetical protein
MALDFTSGFLNTLLDFFSLLPEALRNIVIAETDAMYIGLRIAFASSHI